MRFHELSEEGRIDEVEVVGYFLDTDVGVLQMVLDAFHGMLVDDGQGTLPADFLDNSGQMLGRIAKLVGIVRHGAVSPVVFVHLLHEPSEDIHGAVVAEIGNVFQIGDGSMESTQ